MKKSIIYILIIFILMVMGIIVAVNVNKDSQTKTVSYENVIKNEIENKVDNKIENKQENTIENEQEIEKNEDITEKKLEENIVEDKSDEPKTDLEKAIDIVKEDWGEDNSVYFAQDGQNSKGEYIICVRESDTTNALAWYTVNVTEGTFEKW